MARECLCWETAAGSRPGGHWKGLHALQREAGGRTRSTGSAERWLSFVDSVACPMAELTDICQRFKQEGVSLLRWMKELRAGLGSSSSCPVLRGQPTVTSDCFLTNKAEVSGFSDWPGLSQGSVVGLSRLLPCAGCLDPVGAWVPLAIEWIKLGVLACYQQEPHTSPEPILPALLWCRPVPGQL